MVNERHALAELPEEDLNLADVVPEAIELNERYPRWKINGHWYELRDATAGIRWYVDRRLFWAGFYVISVTDAYTGVPLDLRVVSASVQESQTFLPCLDRVTELTGKTPRSITADRGFSTKAIFEAATERGIYPVIPLRANVNVGEDAPYDLNGAPRCPDCQTRTEFLRHSRRERGRPRNMYTCPNGCGSHQRADGTTAPRQIAVTCDTDPRLHCPLPRTHLLYQELEVARSIFENTHNELRERHLVAGCGRQKLRRVGVNWQQLRCDMAFTTEWIRLLTYEGWFPGSERQNTTVSRQRITRRHPTRRQETARTQQDRAGRGRRRETAHQRRHENGGHHTAPPGPQEVRRR